jgi:hypothetical protein
MLGYRRRRDARGDGRSRAPTPGTRSHRPCLRATSRCPGHGADRAHVARALLAQVPCRLWRDSLLLPHDTTDRACQGTFAPRKVGHRYLHRRRLHVARLVQFALHRDRRRDTVAVPPARPSPPRGRSGVREQARHPAPADRVHRLRAATSVGGSLDRNGSGSGTPDPGDPLPTSGRIGEARVGSSFL